VIISKLQCDQHSNESLVEALVGLREYARGSRLFSLIRHRDAKKRRRTASPLLATRAARLLRIGIAKRACD